MPAISVITIIFATALLSATLWLLYTSFLHPLSKIPGPALARITRIWYVHKVRQGSFDHVARALHKKYGALVRIAPDEISACDPNAVSIIYSTSSTKFTKTDFYPPWRAPGFDKDHPDVFTDQDETRHTARRRLLSSVYSMTSVLEAEQYIDDCTNAFRQQLSTYATESRPMDLGLWLQMYAFEVGNFQEKD